MCLCLEQIVIPRDSPYELLYGRTGYLWACSFLNKHIGNNTIPTTHMVIRRCASWWVSCIFLLCNLFWQDGFLTSVEISSGWSYHDWQTIRSQGKMSSDVWMAWKEILGCCTWTCRNYACFDGHGTQARWGGRSQGYPTLHD